MRVFRLTRPPGDDSASVTVVLADDGYPTVVNTGWTITETPMTPATDAEITNAPIGRMETFPQQWATNTPFPPIVTTHDPEVPPT